MAIQSLYEMEDYREFVRQTAQGPGFGRGTYRSLATAIGVNTTFISQVLGGKKDLSLDQAVGVGRFFSLAERELRYFLLLVQRERAAKKETRGYFTEELHKVREQAQALSSKVPRHKKISGEDQGEFYSSFLYSAIRLLTEVPKYQSPETLSQRLGIDRARVGEILEFLTRTGLCRQDGGRVVIGPAYTHVPKDSPFVQSHHRNWRLKAMTNQGSPSPGDFNFTAPLTLAKEDAVKIRQLLTTVVERCSRVVEESPAEELFCLNLDFFRV